MRAKMPGKKYKVQYPLRDYTFPKEVKIASVRFDATYLHVTLTDERILSIPLKWIPTLYHAKPGEREKYKINHTKRMLVWDPAESEINDEIRIEDYLGTKVGATADDHPKVVREKKRLIKQEKRRNENGAPKKCAALFTSTFELCNRRRRDFLQPQPRLSVRRGCLLTFSSAPADSSYNSSVWGQDAAVDGLAGAFHAWRDRVSAARELNNRSQGRSRV